MLIIKGRSINQKNEQKYFKPQPKQDVSRKKVNEEEIEIEKKKRIPWNLKSNQKKQKMGKKKN